MLGSSRSGILNSVGVITALALAFYLTSLYSYLLIHSLIEIATVAVAFTIFILIWNTRSYLENNYLKILGIGYAFIALIDLLHTLAYKGMNIFPGYGANLPTQLWIAARYLQAVTLIIAPLSIDRKVNNRAIFGGYTVAVLALVAMAFSRNFPDCFIEGKGLTTFKISSEYVITTLLFISCYLLFRKRNYFNDRIFIFIAFSIVFTILSEISFTAYVSVFGFANMVGHFAKLVAFSLIYRAILETSIKEPFDIIFKDLKRANEQLQFELTERKQAEKTLRESEKWFRALSESTRDWIWEIDENARYTYASPRIRDLLGYEPREIIGKTPFDLMPPEEARRVAGEFGNRVSARQPLTFVENVNLHKDGHPVVLETSGISIFDDEGRFKGYRGIDRDISERKRAESALRDKTRQLEDLYRNLEQRVQEEVSLRRKNEEMLVQQSKMAAMGEMLGAIAHQWRQPLNTLGLIVQNLRDAHAQGELDEQYLETTVKKSMVQIQHMSKTIDDFRNFFRPGKDRANFDTMQAVCNVLSLFSAQLVAHEIDFRMICHTHGKTFNRVEDIVPCQEKTARGFQNEFEHVMMNIINNAREAIVERRETGRMLGNGRGIIIVEFRKVNDRITIDVGNNGIAIPENIINRIFEPYFTTKGPAKGTGLGLYMSKVIIEDHMHGRLTAKNGDQGAVFTIELPLVGERIGHE
jgi:PAS domain S-box-containing protein